MTIFKVKLIEQNKTKKDKAITYKISEDHKIEPEAAVQKKQCLELVLKYAVEYPKGENIGFYDDQKCNSVCP